MGKIKKRKTKSRMADAAPALSQATIDLINTRVTGQFAEWKQTGTPEQKAAGAEKLRRMREEPEFMPSRWASLARFSTTLTPTATEGLTLKSTKPSTLLLKP